jgi:hypothetical protein
VGDAIAAARAVGASGGSRRNISWLELDLVSGRKFEVVPITRTADQVEHLGIELREVGEYRSVERWPRGPLVPKHDLTVFDSCLFRMIASARADATIGVGSPDRLTIQFWGGGTWRIAHDPSLPESIRIDVVPHSAA